MSQLSYESFVDTELRGAFNNIIGSNTPNSPIKATIPCPMRIDYELLPQFLF